MRKATDNTQTQEEMMGRKARLTAIYDGYIKSLNQGTFEGREEQEAVLSIIRLACVLRNLLASNALGGAGELASLEAAVSLMQAGKRHLKRRNVTNDDVQVLLSMAGERLYRMRGRVLPYSIPYEIEPRMSGA